MVDAATSSNLQRLQRATLVAIARGEPLQQVAHRICVEAERLAPAALCTILRVDAEGHLRELAAPSLPAHYREAIEGVSIGPAAGACGTAAWRGEAVETIDVSADPLWAGFRDVLPTGLKACWSSPIRARDGRVVGTFAFYYRTTRGPAELERALVEQCVDLCAIAIEHEESLSRIHQLAYFDTLTGLPNRAEFSERAEARLQSLQPGQSLNLLYVDLDDFKSVNDSLGHAAGDLLLECVARRLAACIGEGVFAARLGGDEFAVVQGHPASGDGTLLAQQIIATLEEPFEIESQKIRIGASVGIANATPRMPLTVLARHADMALAEAKVDGRGGWRVFAPAMAAAAQSRRALKHDLRVAIDQREFTLAYQPIVRLGDRALCAVEVLLRWQHPVHGALSPAVFVPIIEEMGMIGTLGDWVLREACRAAARWPLPLKVNVNLSPLQFRKPGFVVDVVSALHQAGLPAERLDLEVTESALLASDLATRTALHDLHDFGVRLSMDDFGTGYSSLQSLRAFPFDRIKLDMSFVRDLAIDADAAAIIRSVIGLARDLGMRTTAEGVEHPVQHDWLLRNGCDEAQGYHFGRPMSEADLLHLLEDTDSGGDASPEPLRASGGGGPRLSSAG